MECVLQWLDDLDDLWSSMALLTEQVRRITLACLFLSSFLAVSALGAFLAFTSPPLAMALVCLLTVTALYRSAVLGQAAIVRS